MDPALSQRRLVDERRHHGDDEARRPERRGHNLDMERRGCKGESIASRTTPNAVAWRCPTLARVSPKALSQRSGVAL
jgi:hypothetical protein